MVLENDNEFRPKLPALIDEVLTLPETNYLPIQEIKIPRYVEHP